MNLTQEQQDALVAFYEAAKAYDEAEDWEQDEELWPYGTSSESDEQAFQMWGALDRAYETFGYSPRSDRPFTWKDGNLFEYEFTSELS